ncbi:TlpA disulfide reductase family protein [Clostridium sp. KNHs205]|uniref:TlpA family protein disulfide reductase n=1 Tax=Clostridium sp. KNHs205 TaxID=1449050 RepID=UPI0012DD9BE3|nr:TlpA disulfide reductase family protein [Clostridium sp. KNHs205]
MSKVRKSMVNFMLVVAVLLLSVGITACGKAEKNQTGNNTAEENSTEEESNTNEDSDNTQSEKEGEDTKTSEEKGTNEEKPLVPDFTLQSSEGEEVTLSDYAGKVVVLNFWASWCPPCKEEMPEFQKLYDELAESEDAVLLMLNQTDGQRETEKKANNYIEEEGLTFPILYDTGEVGGSIFGINSIPTTVVIDREGRLSDYVLGRTEYSKVAQMIEEAK